MKTLLLILFSVGLVFSTCKTAKKTSANEYIINVDTMLPTLDYGYKVTVDTLIKNFTYGDIVRAQYISDKMTFVDFYRIVGLPGDTIGLEDNIVVRNGKKSTNYYIKDVVYKDVINLKEYDEVLANGKRINIYKPAFSFFIERDNANPEIIHENHYYLLGDSRSLSIDSRFCGAVPADRIYGKIIEIKKQD